MKNLLLALALTASTATATPTAPRLYITGEVGGAIVDQADALRSLVSQGHTTVKLVINSPGGSVYAGLQFINAMIAAQAKGVKIKCYVGGMAASMAFQIFAHCNKRYATRYALLLFHPATTNVYGNARELAYTADRLATIEGALIPVLTEALKMDKDLFMYHYKNQTLWTAEELSEVSPNFLQILSDIPGRAIWSAPEAKKMFKKLVKRRGSKK